MLNKFKFMLVCFLIASNLLFSMEAPNENSSGLQEIGIGTKKQIPSLKQLCVSRIENDIWGNNYEFDFQQLPEEMHKYVYEALHKRPAILTLLKYKELLTGMKAITAISISDEFFAAGDESGVFKVFDARTKNCMRTLESDSPNITSMAISSDGQFIAIGSKGYTVEIWDVKIADYEPLCDPAIPGPSLEVSDDGRFRIISLDNTVELWDQKTKKSYKLHDNITYITSIAISRDDKYIITGATDHAVNIWNLKSEQLIATHKVKDIKLVAISRNNKRIIAVYRCGTVEIWGRWSGKCLHAFHVNVDEVDDIIAAAISRGSKFMVVTHGGNIAKVWNIKSGKYIHALKGHTKPICTVTISNNGKIIVTGSKDKTVKIWDTKTGQCLRTLRHGFFWSDITEVAISSDNQFVVVGFANGTIKVWDIFYPGSLQDLVQAIKTSKKSRSRSKSESNCNCICS